MAALYERVLTDCEEAACLMGWLAKRSDRQLEKVIWRLDMEPLKQDIERLHLRLAHWGALGRAEASQR